MSLNLDGPAGAIPGDNPPPLLALLRRAVGGRVPAGGRARDPVAIWINPTSIIAGLLAVSVTAYVAAVLATGLAIVLIVPAF